MNIMVTGGAGYIGSHAVAGLRQAGHQVVVLDNLFRGHREAVPKDAPLEELDLRDTAAVTNALTHHRIEAVMHFAALAYVGESVKKPLEYYDNNTAGTLSLLRAMDQAKVKRMVFSSTCATYGEPGVEAMPLVETTPQQPINAYGWSKLFTERILRDYANAHPDFSFVALRYFNVAGCAGDGSIGEDHEPETHIIPVILLTALGQREKVTIFGDDYDTPDGTCIRDYIYVEDLIDAHIVAMQALKPGDQRFYNLGIGHGHSVRQVIDAAIKVTGRDIRVEAGPRRAGDPPMLYANADKIRDELGWHAQVTDIETIIASAWRWFRNHPQGYEKP